MALDGVRVSEEDDLPERGPDDHIWSSGLVQAVVVATVACLHGVFLARGERSAVFFTSHLVVVSGLPSGTWPPLTCGWLAKTKS